MVVPSTEIYVLNLETKELTRLTVDAAESASEERAVDWSKDGTRIAFMCRIRAQPPPPQLGGNFEICVMNADGTGKTRLTMNTVFEGLPSWSPNGQEICSIRMYRGERSSSLRCRRTARSRHSSPIWISFNLFGTGVNVPVRKHRSSSPAQGRLPGGWWRLPKPGQPATYRPDTLLAVKRLGMVCGRCGICKRKRLPATERHALFAQRRFQTQNANALARKMSRRYALAHDFCRMTNQS